MNITSASAQQPFALENTLVSNLEQDPLEKVLGTNQNDVLQALPIGSAIYGLDGSDVAIGSTTDDILFGNNGDDFLLGRAGNDLLNGGGQADLLYGEQGEDQLVGGSGDDLMRGGTGNDSLSGQSGDDRLVGGGGDDFLHGGAGTDIVLGGRGNDALADYYGGDLLTGGRGSDEFWVGDPTAVGATVIQDFEVGSDQIKVLRLGTSFESLAIRDGEGGVVISDQGKPIAVINGITAEALEPESFIFGQQEFADELKNKLKDALSGTLIPGMQAMVVAPDGTIWNGAEGLANIDTSEPLSPNSLLSINSTSKYFVGTIVLQLIEEGKLDLDESFDTYLPEVAAQIDRGDQITIRQLLSHTSGLEWGSVEFVPVNDPVIRARLIDDTSTPELLRDFLVELKDEKVVYATFEDSALAERLSLTPESFEEIQLMIEELALDPDNYTDLQFTEKDYVELVYDEPLLSDPGTEFYYSDTNQEILALIIAEVTGTSYLTQLHERILEPLGMNDTVYTPAEGLPDGYPPLYSDSDGDGRTDQGLINSIESPYTSFLLFGYTAGGIFSTPRDMTRFVQALYRGELLTPNTIDMATSNGNTDIATFDYGLTTMYTDNSTVGRIWSHSGGGEVSSGWTAFFPDLDASIVTMVNGGDSEPKMLTVDGESFEGGPRAQFLFEASGAITEQFPDSKQ